jgi:hypothetical protein
MPVLSQALIAAVHESAIGPKRTFVAAPHVSAFGGKADMAICTAKCPLMTPDITTALNAVWQFATIIGVVFTSG